MTVTIGRPVLQVGSNIFELVEFVLAPDQVAVESPSKNSFGVNVAKVREVIRMPEIVPCLTTCESVLGVFNLRGHPIPVIHLGKALGLPGLEVGPSSQIIVTEFSRRLAGFVVAGTKRIRRVNWDKVLPPSSDTFGHITGMMLVENNKFIFILDFERILLEIEGQGQNRSYSSNPSLPYGGHDARDANMESITKEQRSNLIMVVDDSPTARRSLVDLLGSIGIPCISYANGEEAWAALQDLDRFKSQGGIGAIISDVEMPKLDGYSLAKRLRGSETLRSMPFILHSSLTGQVNKDRAFQAGANAYVTKFNKKEIADALRKFLPGNVRERAS